MARRKTNPVLEAFRAWRIGTEWRKLYGEWWERSTPRPVGRPRLIASVYEDRTAAAHIYVNLPGRAGASFSWRSAKSYVSDQAAKSAATQALTRLEKVAERLF